MTDHELTRAEIKIQVDAAYDTYLDRINQLGGQYGSFLLVTRTRWLGRRRRAMRTRQGSATRRRWTTWSRQRTT